MSEASAWSTLRSKLLRPGIHIQRLEDSMAVGVPDTNLCYRGKEIWLEGKYAEMPKRLTTVIRPNLAFEQATWLESRTLAGGTCYVWVRLADRGWLLVGKDFRELVTGIVQEELGRRWMTFKHAKDMAERILNG